LGKDKSGARSEKAAIGTGRGPARRDAKTKFNWHSVVAPGPTLGQRIQTPPLHNQSQESTNGKTPGAWPLPAQAYNRARVHPKFFQRNEKNQTTTDLTPNRLPNSKKEPIGPKYKTPQMLKVQFWQNHQHKICGLDPRKARRPNEFNIRNRPNLP
jgi:hypothetical protein